jgi:hypothetical protein
VSAADMLAIVACFALAYAISLVVVAVLSIIWPLILLAVIVMGGAILAAAYFS